MPDSDAKIQQLRDATREANLVLAEMKDVLKEWRALRKELPGTVHELFERDCQAAINREMDAAAGEIIKSIQGAEKKVTLKLERLADAAVSMGASKPNLEDVLIAENVIRWMKKQQGGIASFTTGAGLAMVLEKGGPPGN